MMRVGSWRLGLLLVVLLNGSPALAADAGVASTTLTIAGTVAQSTSFLPATLRSLPVELVLRAPDGASRTDRGVLLRDLLLAAKPIEEGHFDLRQSLVVARATDGYVAVFSREELVGTPGGDGVLVATSRDGQPLADNEDAFTLMSTVDRRSGPRHVRWLASIELRRVAP